MLQNLFPFGKSLLFGERKEHFSSGIVKWAFSDLAAVADCY